MGCFYCIRPSSKDVRDYDEDMARGSANTSGRKGGSLRGKTVEGSAHKGNVARSFTFKELATATQNFRQSNLLGEGGFGSVFKGRLDSDLASFYALKCFSFGLILCKIWFSPEHRYLIFFYFRLLKFWFSYVRANYGAYDQIVAVKRLNLDGLQGNQEFIVEVLMLSLLHHQNLVNLIGYCTDGDQRLLVYEFMSMGSLENHLYDLEPGIKPLSWCTRLKIAAGAAQGLEYLHCKANPPVIYRDLKSSNILLDDNFKPKLSDFGLAKLGPVGDNTHVSTRVMGTYGYCAPEYAMSGKLTLKSDIYSFGVVMLELITGRKAYDNARKQGEQNLVAWSQPFLRDRRKFVQMVDPLLEGQYSVRCLQHAVAITAMCLQEQANFRPLISDIVVALEYLVSQAECSDSQKPGVPGKTHLVPPLDPNDDHKR